jgi:hypothetical protein
MPVGAVIGLDTQLRWDGQDHGAQRGERGNGHCRLHQDQADAAPRPPPGGVAAAGQHCLIAASVSRHRCRPDALCDAGAVVHHVLPRLGRWLRPVADTREELLSDSWAAPFEVAATPQTTCLASSR